MLRRAEARRLRPPAEPRGRSVVGRGEAAHPDAALVMVVMRLAPPPAAQPPLRLMTVEAVLGKANRGMPRPLLEAR